jgi:hypothetical protein
MLVCAVRRLVRGGGLFVKQTYDFAHDLFPRSASIQKLAENLLNSFLIFGVHMRREFAI